MVRADKICRAGGGWRSRYLEVVDGCERKLSGVNLPTVQSQDEQTC